MKHGKLIIGVVLLLLISIPTFLYFNYGNNKSLVKNTSSTSNSEPKENTSDDTNNNSSSTTNDSSKSTSNSTSELNDSSSSAMAANMTYLSVDNFATSLNCINYTIKSGDTLTSICNKYSTYCNLNSSINLVTIINNITNPEELKIGDTLKIPESTFVSGTLYNVSEGDTWYKIRDTYYQNYDIDNIMKFIIDLNKLPNEELPLGESIFLPSLSV